MLHSSNFYKAFTLFSVLRCYICVIYLHVILINFQSVDYLAISLTHLFLSLFPRHFTWSVQPIVTILG